MTISGDFAIRRRMPASALLARPEFADSEHKTRQRRDAGWPAEPRVVAGQSPVVLLQADLHEVEEADLDRRHRLGARHREVAVLMRDFLVGAHAARKPDAQTCDVNPGRSDTQLEPDASPPTEAGAAPCQPVGEEQDVPAFLLDDRLERLDEPCRKETRSLGQREKPEGKEAVDRFRIARDKKSQFPISRWQVRRFLGQLDAVGAHHVREDLLVAVLFPRIQHDGRPYLGIVERIGVGGKAEARPALRLHGEAITEGRYGLNVSWNIAQMARLWAAEPGSRASGSTLVQCRAIRSAASTFDGVVGRLPAPGGTKCSTSSARSRASPPARISPAFGFVAVMKARGPRFEIELDTTR